jgi:hypothetical protein
MAPETNWFHDLTNDEAKEERATLAQRLIAWLGVVCLIVLVGLATNAHAVQLNHQECQGFAVWSHDIQLMRDVGADKEKVRAYLESKKDDIPYFGMLLKSLDGLWKSKSDRGATAQAVYDDCVKRRGVYGMDV